MKECSDGERIPCARSHVLAQRISLDLNGGVYSTEQVIARHGGALLGDLPAVRATFSPRVSSSIVFSTSIGAILSQIWLYYRIKIP